MFACDSAVRNRCWRSLHEPRKNEARPGGRPPGSATGQGMSRQGLVRKMWWFVYWVVRGGGSAHSVESSRSSQTRKLSSLQRSNFSSKSSISHPIEPARTPNGHPDSLGSANSHSPHAPHYRRSTNSCSSAPPHPPASLSPRRNLDLGTRLGAPARTAIITRTALVRKCGPQTAWRRNILPPAKICRKRR